MLMQEYNIEPEKYSSYRDRNVNMKREKMKHFIQSVKDLSLKQPDKKALLNDFKLLISDALYDMI